MAGSSAFEFARAAARAGLMSRRELAGDALANLAFRLKGSTDASTDAVRERVGQALAGVRQRDLLRLGPDMLAGILPRVYPQMLRTAYEHQDAGRRVYICTAASAELADVLAGVLRFDGAVGTRPEVVDGVYTGRIDGPFVYREGKAEAVRRLAEHEGFDLAECYAYSDSESDLPFLRLVGHPVAVNPDAPLARMAREEGWEIMRFETLGRRLKLIGAVAVAALAGGAGSALARRRRPPSRRVRVPMGR
jgi:HAD superfamily hydrolase (TIGR01490 family)